MREEKSALSVKLKKQESHRDEITHLLVFHDREILREQLHGNCGGSYRGDYGAVYVNCPDENV